MAQQGATLQNYNNELVKCIEDLREKREEVRRAEVETASRGRQRGEEAKERKRQRSLMDLMGRRMGLCAAVVGKGRVRSVATRHGALGKGWSLLDAHLELSLVQTSAMFAI